MPSPNRNTKRAALAAEPMRTCTECSQAFVPLREDQAFCSTPCRTESKNRELIRGRKAYRLLYHWVKSGGRMGADPKHSLGELTRLTRGWIAEDKKEGREPPPPFNHNY